MTSEHQLIEAELARLSNDVDWPDGDVTAPVLHRIAAVPQTGQSRRVVWRVAVAALAAMIVVVAVPAGRQAIADLLGVAGINITFTEQAPTSGDDRLHLGEPVSLEAATDRIGFPITLPGLARVGPPQAIHIQEGPPRIIHATWDATPDLPAVPGTDIGLLLTEFRSVSQSTAFVKELSDGTSVEITSVGGEQARWIEGAPHRLTYRSTQGTETREISRLAANVLIWEKSGITYRLESTLELDSARRIADTLRPASS